jgi:acyl dehydratase
VLDAQSFITGDPLHGGPYQLSETDIIDFARAFDPQPYHLDAQAGAESIFGGLCASGWQTAALTFRLLADALSQGGYRLLDLHEVSQLRWRRPLFVDESINVVVTARESSALDGSILQVQLALEVTGATASDVLAELTARADIETSPRADKDPRDV